jgi:hypothetical protein
MESNICSIFGKISGITEVISKLRGVSVISEGGQVDKNKVEQLMIKNPDGLTEEEKEMLAYAKIVLGEKEYAKLKNKAIEDNKPITFDDIATAPWTSGGVGVTDKRIGQKIDGMTYNQLNERLKNAGYDRTYRRNLMRYITKDYRDLKIGDELPKGVKFELPKELKLAKGFGVASTALAGVTAVEDLKNNDTNAKRATAIGIDVVETGAAYVATNAIVAGIAVVAAPKVAIVGAGLIAGGGSYAASKVKGWLSKKYECLKGLN